jgi:hypothetical protein
VFAPVFLTTKKSRTLERVRDATSARGALGARRLVVHQPTVYITKAELSILIDITFGWRSGWIVFVAEKVRVTFKKGVQSAFDHKVDGSDRLQQRLIFSIVFLFGVLI